jgi:two-component system, chemotaxis family, protein-glutamate methylesterase/glutaminase
MLLAYFDRRCYDLGGLRERQSRTLLTTCRRSWPRGIHIASQKVFLNARVLSVFCQGGSPTGAFMREVKNVGRDFPLVCVGGSAGGLDAYTLFLRHLPSDLGAAIVIVNHLRTVDTLLHQILPRFTPMPVELISQRLRIRSNHVFIIPAQRDLHILNGEFVLKPISKPRGWPDVITVFLRSLARHWNGKIIAVIVSGYDGDGAEALCGIRDVGGVTIAQTLESAGQPDMPASAIASGCIDFILPPEKIAAQIANIIHFDR